MYVVKQAEAGARHILAHKINEQVHHPRNIFNLSETYMLRAQTVTLIIIIIYKL